MTTISALFFGLLSMALSYRMFFKTHDDFFEAVRHCFTPDIISAFRGEWGQDQWNEMKLGCWIGGGALGALGGSQLFAG
jgi:hypothetical protein